MRNRHLRSIVVSNRYVNSSLINIDCEIFETMKSRAERNKNESIKSEKMQKHKKIEPVRRIGPL